MTTTKNGTNMIKLNKKIMSYDENLWILNHRKTML